VKVRVTLPLSVETISLVIPLSAKPRKASKREF